MARIHPMGLNPGAGVMQTIRPGRGVWLVLWGVSLVLARPVYGRHVQSPVVTVARGEEGITPGSIEQGDHNHQLPGGEYCTVEESPGACAYQERLWLTGEYLLWWLRE